MFEGRQAVMVDLSDFDVPVFRHPILVGRLDCQLLLQHRHQGAQE